MKTEKLFLDIEEDRQVSVGIITLKEKLPYHELFFKINQINSYHFRREKDFRVENTAGFYDFPRFEAFDDDTQNRIIVIANQSHHFQKKETPIIDLFDLIEEKFFIDEKIDFIVFTKDGEINFDLFLPVDISPMRIIKLAKNDELNQIILDYDEQKYEKNKDYRHTRPRVIE